MKQPKYSLRLVCDLDRDRETVCVEPSLEYARALRDYLRREKIREAAKVVHIFAIGVVFGVALAVLLGGWQ